MAGLLEGLQLLAVVEVGGAALFAEEQPVAAGVAAGPPVLQEADERGDAGPRTDHDHRGGGVRGRPEVRGAPDVDRHRPVVGAVRQVGGAHAVAPAAEVVGVADHGDGEPDLAGVRERAGGDGVQPRLEPPQHTGPLGGRGPDRVGADHVDGLPAPAPLGELALVVGPQQPSEVPVAGPLGDEAQQFRGDPGDVQPGAQRLAERHRAGVRDVHRVVGVQAGDGEPFGDQGGAVGGPHPEGVPGLVGEFAAAGVEGELPYLLLRAGEAEQPVADQQGRERGRLGVDRRPARGRRGGAGCGGRGGPRGGGRGARGEGGADLVEPPVGGLLVVGFAVGARHQAGGAEGFEAFVEAPAVAAEVLVGGVAEGDHGVAQAGQRPPPGGGQRRPEPGAVVRRLPVAEGAAEEEHRPAGRQCVRGGVVHGGQPRPVAPLGEPPGHGGRELLGVAGLRGPEHQHLRGVPGRGVGRGAGVPGRGGRRRTGEQAGQQPVHPQGAFRVERRVGGEDGDARQVRRGLQSGEEAGQVALLRGGEHRPGGRREAEDGGQGGQWGRGTGGVRRERHRGPGREQVRRGGGHRGGLLRFGGGDHPQRDGAGLEFRLEGDRVDRVVGDGVDAEVLAEQVVPVERREAVPGPYPVGDDGGQYGAAAPGGDLQVVAGGDAQRGRVVRVDLDERPGVQPAELGDLPGLGEGVPLVLQPPGVEHERVVVVREFGRRQVGPGEEPGPAGGGREGQRGPAAVGADQQGLADAVVQVPDRVAVGSVGVRGRPLHRGGAQPLVVDTAQVPAGGGVPGLLELLEDLFGAGVAEAVREAHRAGHPGDQPPVRQGLAGRVQDALDQGEVALGVDHDAVGLRPERGGQHHVGVRVGLGVGEHVLGDHQIGRLQAGDDGPPVADRGDRVGADDPAGLDLAGRHPLEHLDRAAADLGAQGPRRQPPQVLGEGAFGLDQDGALAGQAGAHVAHLAAAHRVGLAGERERAAAGAADRPGGQVQVDQRVGVPGAVGGLVEAHRPAAHPLPRRADPPGGLPDAVLGEAGEFGDPVGRVVGEEGGQLLPALGVLGDELLVHLAGLDQQVQQAVQQGQVGAGPDRQVQVGLVRGGAAPRVDHDQLGTGLHPVHHPQEQDRVAVRHVGADHQEDVGVVEVPVRAGRPVGAQRQLVAGARAGHAQPGVGLDLVGPHEALGQLVDQVLRLQAQLARDVERQRVRPVLVEDRAQPSADRGDGRVHVGGGGRGAALGAHQRPFQPAGRGHQVGAGRALGAEPAGVRRVVAVAGGAGRGAPSGGRVAGDVEHDPAADAAVRADRPHAVRPRA